MEAKDSLVSNRQHPGGSTIPHSDHIIPIGHGFRLQQGAGRMSSYFIDSMPGRANGNLLVIEAERLFSLLGPVVFYVSASNWNDDKSLSLPSFNSLLDTLSVSMPRSRGK